jgi:hypothetical protein
MADGSERTMKASPLAAVVSMILLIVAGGCKTAPEEVLDAPSRWPAQWAGRTLYNTPHAFIYAASDGAAGEADRLVREQVDGFVQEHHAEPAKGLVIVTDVRDELFTGDLESLLLIVASERARQDPDQAADEEVTAESLTAVSHVAPLLGMKPGQLAMISALPLGRDDMAALLELPAEEWATFAWAVSAPTEAAMKSSVKRSTKLITDNVDPLTRVALIPLLPIAQSRAAKELAAKRAEMVGDQMRWADPALTEIMVDRIREWEAPEGVP